MKRQNVRTLSLIVVTFTYLLLGAAIFDAFESTFEVEEERRLSQAARDLRNKYNMTKDDFDHITQLGIQMKPYKAGTQWKFAGAFYFATTVITTIGYGHSTPKTTWGKIFCMCYAVPGIPLCLVMFQSIGERLNTIITWLLRQAKKVLSCHYRSVSQTNLMIVSFTTGSTVLTIGAAVFARYEDWNYLDSFYYCFITLTTIGFGDFVALQRNDSLAKRPDYVAFSLIFILFGLTVVSSVMNLLVLRFLTMNTEDERRDQLEAAAQAQELQRLRGDVIWTDNKLSPGLFHPFALEVRQPAKCAEGTCDAEVCVHGPPFARNLQKFLSGLSNLFTSQSRLSLLTPCSFTQPPSTNATGVWNTSGMHQDEDNEDERMNLSEHSFHVPLSHFWRFPPPCCPGSASHHRPSLVRSLSLPEPLSNCDIMNRSIGEQIPRYSEVLRKSVAWNVLERNHAETHQSHFPNNSNHMHTSFGVYDSQLDIDSQQNLEASHTTDQGIHCPSVHLFRDKFRNRGSQRKHLPHPAASHDENDLLWAHENYPFNLSTWQLIPRYEMGSAVRTPRSRPPDSDQSRFSPCVCATADCALNLERSVSAQGYKMHVLCSQKHSNRQSLDGSSDSVTESVDVLQLCEDKTTVCSLAPDEHKRSSI